MGKYLDRTIEQYHRRLKMEPVNEINLHFLAMVDHTGSVAYTTNIVPEDLPQFVQDLVRVVRETEQTYNFVPGGKPMPTVTIPKDRVVEVLGMMGKRNANPMFKYPPGKVLLSGFENGRNGTDGSLFCVLRFRRYAPPPRRGEQEVEEPALVDMSYLAELIGNDNVYVP